MNRIRGRTLRLQQARIGAPDAALTGNAGLAPVSELCGRLGVIAAIDEAVGPVKQRERGFGAGELLAGIVAAQLAGEDFLTGLDRQRADRAGQQLCLVPGADFDYGRWPGAEGHADAVASGGTRGGGGHWADGVAAARAAGGGAGRRPVMIDLDTTDVEVYGRKKRGVFSVTWA